MMKRQVDKIDPVRSKFGKIEKEEVTVSDKFIYIHEYMHTHHKFSFRQLLEKLKEQDAYCSDISGGFRNDEAGRNSCGTGRNMRRDHD